MQRFAMILMLVGVILVILTALRVTGRDRSLPVRTDAPAGNGLVPQLSFALLMALFAYVAFAGGT